MTLERPDSAPNLNQWEEEFRLQREWMTELEEKIGDRPLGEQLRNPLYLPARKEVFDYFKISNLDKDDPERPRAEARRMMILRTGAFFEHPAIREILNQEFIQALGKYVSERVEDSSSILEVGAGSGRLAHFLQEEMRRLSRDVHIIATDRSSDGIPIVFPITSMDTKTALSEFQPNLVISSWMPPSRDWSANFRQTPSVKEYILIGEEDVTGDRWETWGASAGDAIPPYARDGFERVDLPDISRFQLCANDHIYDYDDSDEGSISKTVSFRRVKT